MDYKSIVKSYFDYEGIKYEDTKEFSLRVTYTGDHLKSIPINVFFDKDGDGIIQLDCWSIANFKDKEAAGILMCNQLNAKYRWVKFYVDDDKDIRCQLDAYIDQDSCGSECLNLIRRSVNIIDESYPVFMKAYWND